MPAMFSNHFVSLHGGKGCVQVMRGHHALTVAGAMCDQ